MKKTHILYSILLVIGFASTVSCQSEMTVESLPEMNFDQLETYLSDQKEEVLVVNFWATWCVPCVEELPYFEQATEEFQDADVKVILVSLDFTKTIKTKLVPFINQHELKSEVVWLNDPRMNEWINKVSEEWSGAIPATLYISGNSREFKEGKYASYDDLKKSISKFQKL